MLSWIRLKFGTALTGGVIAFVAFMFVFYGVFGPRATRGLHEGAVAASVNQEPITLQEFRRELDQKLQYLRKVGGKELSDEMLRQFRLESRVIDELIQRKLLVQGALAQGLVPSDDEVKRTIREIPVFGREGSKGIPGPFEVSKYKELLSANRLTPGAFEKNVRDGLAAQQWEEYFGLRINVTENEIRDDFTRTQEKRQIKYVVLSDQQSDAPPPAAQEVKAYLEDAVHAKAVRARFDETKAQLYPNQEFDDVKMRIAQELQQKETQEERQRKWVALGDPIKDQLKPGGASDATLNKFLKAHHTQVRTSAFFNRDEKSLEGLGAVPEVIGDAFRVPLREGRFEGAVAKKYILPKKLVVALVIGQQSPDFAQLPAERLKRKHNLSLEKREHAFNDFLKRLRERASIDINPAIYPQAEGNEDSAG